MADYKLLTYQTSGRPRTGLLVNDRIHDAAELSGESADASVLSLLEDWDAARGRLWRAAGAALDREGLPLDKVALRTPILYPPTIYCAGANYKDLAEEMVRRLNRPREPDPHTLGLKCFFFMKAGRTAADPDAVLPLSEYSDELDWEIELAVVIGRKASRVREAAALDHVAGYTIANDLSARDVMRRPHVSDTSLLKADWISSKNFDGGCPIGPWIAPAHQIQNPQNLALQLAVNGSIKQNSNTAHMIYSIEEQIAHLSSRMTLYPGDVILTGTPAGIGMIGRDYLKRGDIVKHTIDQIGSFTTTIA